MRVWRRTIFSELYCWCFGPGFLTTASPSSTLLRIGGATSMDVAMSMTPASRRSKKSALDVLGNLSPELHASSFEVAEVKADVDPRMRIMSFSTSRNLS